MKPEKESSEEIQGFEAKKQRFGFMECGKEREKIDLELGKPEE